MWVLKNLKSSLEFCYFELFLVSTTFVTHFDLQLYTFTYAYKQLWLVWKPVTKGESQFFM